MEPLRDQDDDGLAGTRHLGRRRFVGTACVALGAVAAPGAAGDSRAQPPSAATFGPAQVDIRSLGAVGDGSALNTTAIQAAIDRCHLAGGGTVLVPAGRFLTGSLFLKSRVRLGLEPGAVLLGSPDITHYSRWIPSHRALRTGSPVLNLISADGAEDIAITGPGIIDGQGAAFSDPPGTGPEERRQFRPHLLQFVACRGVRVEGVTLRNSGLWMQHYLACDHVAIHGLRVFNHANHNNDMIDIDGCRWVTVADCIGDSDDDGITLKSTSNRPCEHVTITNCIVSSHCNAIKLGTESHGGFRDIVISNCVVMPSAVEERRAGARYGLAGVALEIVDGGSMDGVMVSNLRIRGTEVPLFVRLGNRGRVIAPGQPPPGVGRIENIRIANVDVTETADYGCVVSGLPGHPVRRLSITGLSVRFRGGMTRADASRVPPELPDRYPECTMFGRAPAYGLWVRHAEEVSITGSSLAWESEDGRSAVVLDDVHGFEVGAVSMAGHASGDPLVRLRDATDGTIQGCRVTGDAVALVDASAGVRDVAVIGNDAWRAGRLVALTDGANADAVRTVGNHTKPRSGPG